MAKASASLCDITMGADSQNWELFTSFLLLLFFFKIYIYLGISTLVERLLRNMGTFNLHYLLLPVTSLHCPCHPVDAACQIWLARGECDVSVAPPPPNAAASPRPCQTSILPRRFSVTFHESRQWPGEHVLAALNADRCTDLQSRLQLLLFFYIIVDEELLQSMCLESILGDVSYDLC